MDVPGRRSSRDQKGNCRRRQHCSRRFRSQTWRAVAFSGNAFGSRCYRSRGFRGPSAPSGLCQTSGRSPFHGRRSCRHRCAARAQPNPQLQYLFTRRTNSGCGRRSGALTHCSRPARATERINCGRAGSRYAAPRWRGLHGEVRLGGTSAGRFPGGILFHRCADSAREADRIWTRPLGFLSESRNY